MTAVSGNEEALSPPVIDAIDWRTFAVAGAVLGITQLAFYLTAAALPLYLRDHGAPASRIGFDVSVGSFVGLALVLVTGPAINRYSPQLFLRIAGAVYLASSLGMLLFQDEAAITLFRAVQGAGAAIIIPSAYTLGARLMPGRPATALGTLGALNSAALAIGPLIGLVLYNAGGALALFLPATVAAGLGLLATLLLPPARRSPAPAPGFGYSRAWTPSILANTFAVMNFGGILAYLPLVLRQVHGPNAGIFFTADALGVLLLRIPTGILADRYGSFAPKLFGLLITLPGIAALALTPSVFSLIMSGAATGIGAALFIVGVTGDLARLSTAANRGTAMSLAAGSFSAAIFIGGVISGFLIGSGGWNAILIFGELTTLAALPFIFRRIPVGA